jgi:replicative DNA helicase
VNDKPRRSKLSVSAFDLEKQLRRLSLSTLGLERARWPYRGLDCGFPILNEKIDGFHNCIYVLASAARMGKTTFALQFAFDVLCKNPEAHVLFVSLDQPVRDLNIRLVAMAGECHTDYVQHPDAKNAEKYDARRQLGLSRAVKLKSRLTIVDESLGGLGLSDLIDLVRQVKRRKSRPILVVIDPYYKIRFDRRSQEMDAISERLMGEFKTLATSEEVAIVATTRLDRKSVV